MERVSQLLVREKKWICFALLVVFIWGMAAHGYAFSDNSVSHDSMKEFHAEILGNDIKLGSGRVFTPIYRDLLGSDVTLPWFSGLLALTWIGLAVFLTIRMFRVESKLMVILIAGVFTTNIAVSATTATYIHDLDSYMFSMLCAVAAAYLWKNVRHGWIFGAALVALSLGIYQSYLFVTVTLVMIDCIFQLFDECSFREVLTKGLKAIAMILLGGALYYIAMKTLLYLQGVQLVTGEYNSMDLILHQTPGSIMQLILGAYADWFQRIFYAYSSYPSVMVKGITIVLFAICAVGIVTALCNKNLHTAQRILCVLLIALLPLGMNLIYVLIISRNHDLMTFPIWLFYVFALLVSDRLAKKCKSQGNSPASRIVWWQRGICFLLMAVLLYGNVRFSNGMYMKKDLEYDAYLSLMTRIVGRMEAEEDYVPGETKVVFVGTPENRNAMIPGFKDYWNVTGMISTDVIYTPERGRFQAYFDYVMGVPICLAEGELWNEIVSNEETQEMPCYPAAGCLAYYDDVLVVKLGEINRDETVVSYYELPD